MLVLRCQTVTDAVKYPWTVVGSYARHMLLAGKPDGESGGGRLRKGRKA